MEGTSFNPMDAATDMETVFMDLLNEHGLYATYQVQFINDNEDHMLGINEINDLQIYEWKYPKVYKCC